MNQDLEQFIQQAIKEDIAQVGDITTLATISKDQTGHAHFLVKEACVIAGVEMVTCIAQIVDADLQVQFAVQDGDTVTQNQKIASQTKGYLIYCKQRCGTWRVLNRVF